MDYEKNLIEKITGLNDAELVENYNTIRESNAQKRMLKLGEGLPKYEDALHLEILQRMQGHTEIPSPKNAEENFLSKINLICSTNRMTDEECRHIYGLPKLQCLLNGLKAVNKAAEEL